MQGLMRSLITFPLSNRGSLKLPDLLTFRIQHPWFGGQHGHSVDLMSLDSNVQVDLRGLPLPHFTPFPSPLSSGVDFFAQCLSQETDPRLRNPYVFPPILLTGAVLNHLRHHRVSCTVVVLDVFPRRYWWPLLSKSSRHSLKISSRGKQGVVLAPSRLGFSATFRLPWDLWAFRI